jgi:hypothetical protein
MPDDGATDPETPREAGPLGSEVSVPADDDEASGVAGPSYPPEETEPDAH